jgi:HSP20 family protein
VYFARLQEIIPLLPTLKKQRRLGKEKLRQIERLRGTAVAFKTSLNSAYLSQRTAQYEQGGGAMAKKQNDLISFPMHLSHEVERLFDEMIHRPWGFCRDIRGWNPSVDLYETEDAFILEADLPGVKADDVKVEIENSDLILQGWRSLEKSQRHGQFHTMERSSGHFMRRMKLPESVNKEAIQATFHDGVLEVTIPKDKARRGEAK